MLSVFAGPFRIGDVQAVLDLDAPGGRDHLRLLVDSSWLVVTRGSEQNLFSMLETIRSFAALQLDQTGDGPGGQAAARAAFRRDRGRQRAGPWRRRRGRLDEPARGRRRRSARRAVLGRRARRGRPRPGHQRRAVAVVAGQRPARGRPELAGTVPRAGRATRGRASRPRAVLGRGPGRRERRLCRPRSATPRRRWRSSSTLGLTDRMALAATVLGSAHRYLGNHAGARQGFQLAMDLRAELGDRRGVSVAINNMALLELDDGNLRPGAGAVRAGAGHQARARRAAVDSDRPGQPRRRADQDQPVGRGRPGAARGRRPGGRSIRS